MRPIGRIAYLNYVNVAFRCNYVRVKNSAIEGSGRVPNTAELKRNGNVGVCDLKNFRVHIGNFNDSVLLEKLPVVFAFLGESNAVNGFKVFPRFQRIA